MLTYSIAIRTLGTGGNNYRCLLNSIVRQTLQPERVMVYIAEGYEIPDFRIGREEYVTVSKGMLRQRALNYDEIDSDCILMLDDDVELEPDTAERLINGVEFTDSDCMAADVFANHRMPLLSKVKAAITSQAIPSFNDRMAFRLRRSGAFSYVNNPWKGWSYQSDSAAGPAAMWRKKSFLALHIEDEVWIDNDGFAYGDDQLIFYKLVVNGMSLRVMFGSGVKHLDSGSSSGAFRRDMVKRMYVRAKNGFIIWWRTLYEPRPSVLTALCFGMRALFNSLVVLCLLRPSLISAHFKGLRDGIRFVRSDAYRMINPYRFLS